MNSTDDVKKKLGLSYKYQVFEPWLEANGFSVRDLPLTAVNGDGESVIIEIDGKQDGEYIWKTSTLQTNDWIRVNIYYPDCRVDEFYER